MCQISILLMLIGKIKGERSDSAIMLSAHYDHLGPNWGEMQFSEEQMIMHPEWLCFWHWAKYYGENQPKFDTYFLFTTAGEEIRVTR